MFPPLIIKWLAKVSGGAARGYIGLSAAWPQLLFTKNAFSLCSGVIALRVLGSFVIQILVSGAGHKYGFSFSFFCLSARYGDVVLIADVSAGFSFIYRALVAYIYILHTYMLYSFPIKTVT